MRFGRIWEEKRSLETEVQEQREMSEGLLVDVSFPSQEKVCDCLRLALPSHLSFLYSPFHLFIPACHGLQPGVVIGLGLVWSGC